MKLLCCLLLTIIYHPVFCQSSWYVATTGNDSNPGTFAQPWKTIQKAADNATPGSTVYISGGTYIENVVMNVSGTPGAYIVFRNYDATPVIISGNHQPAKLMTLNGVSYVEIRGLHFRDCLGSVSAGIMVLSGGWRGPSHHIRIIGNTIKNLYASADTTTYAPNIYAGGISVAGYDPVDPIRHLLIDSNLVADCRTGWTEAMGITGYVDSFTVSNNTITNTGNIGIDASGHWGISSDPATDFPRNGLITGNHVSKCKSLIEGGTGIYLDGSSNIIIERNIVHENVIGIAVGGETPNYTVRNNIVRNNVSYGNEGCGIGIMGWSPENRAVENCTIINNTTYANAQNPALQYLGEIAVIYSHNTVVKNNISFASNPASKVLFVSDNPVNLQLSYNTYYAAATPAYFDWKGTLYNGFSAYQTGSSNDTYSTFGDPMFANAGSFDFHLQNGSGCIDAGDPAYSPPPEIKDKDGADRKKGANVDRGAFEYDPGPPAIPEAWRLINNGVMVNNGTTLHAGPAAQTFINHGTYEAGNGKDYFIGLRGAASEQEIAGTQKPAFGELYFNNGTTSSCFITNEQGISVSQKLVLNNGITHTLRPLHKNGAVSLLNGAVITGATSNNRHINGYLHKLGNEAFSFPVGSGSRLRTLTVSAPNNANTGIAVAWITGEPAATIDPSDQTTHPTDSAFLQSGIEAISTTGYWDWICTAVHTNTLNVSVSIPDLTGFATAGQLRLAGWNGQIWITLSDTATATGNTEGSILKGVISPDHPVSALAIAKIATGIPGEQLMWTKTGLTTPSAIHINVFPNPATGEIQVKGIPPKTVVKIFDIQGRLIDQKVPAHDTVRFTLKQLAAGTYILRLEDASGKLISGSKFIKQ
ncbi:right-handed parallel beta-helix repeat-containing protein [Chitinophaga defluvii]|uniref:T9SS type A sorting domain-containing protein n=1 Tax=Chitinophaga defluvii TaxID=3163343 RepID=A0ABV2T1S6_9BACT